jgi:toxin ParE1/3/4
MGFVRLSHLADWDLDSIRGAITLHNPAAANDLIEEVFATLEILAIQPLIGQARDDLSPGLRAFTVRPYVVLYYPAESGIHVARIVHGARDFPALFGGAVIG